MMRVVHNAAVGIRLLPHLDKLWRLWGSRRDLARAREMVPAILATIPPRNGALPPVQWSIQRTEWTETDVVVIALGPAEGPPMAVLKLPQTSDGVGSLQRQVAVVAELHADLRLGEWRTVLPNLLVQGEISGQVYVVEQALPGRDARNLLFDPVARRRLQIAGAATIGELHRRTAVSVVVDEEMFARWVDKPVNLIRRSIPMLFRSARNDGAFKRLVAELHGTFAGHALSVSWIHGDFWPGNMLITPDSAILTGIVDWDLAGRDELPLHDLLHLLLYTRKLVLHCELGDVIRALLSGTGWTPHERMLLEATRFSLIGDAAGERAMLLLYWLRHVASNFIQNPDCGDNWLWVTRNIESVLQCL